MCVGQRVLLELHRPEPWLDQLQVLYERIAENAFEGQWHGRRLGRSTDKRRVGGAQLASVLPRVCRLSDHQTIGSGVPLTDSQWARLEPLLPDRTPRRRGRWRDRREVIDAIAFKYRTGTPWADLPERFGPWKGAHNRLRMWAPGGTREKVSTALPAQTDADGEPDRVVAVDSTIVRAHRHAAGARQKGRLAASPPIVPSDASAVGRRRGRLGRRRAALRAARLRDHAGPGRRRAGVRAGHGADPGSPAGRPAPHETGGGPGRQGLFIADDPRRPATARDPGGDPAARRPGRRP
ncbi:IS5 family transposase [Kitasatospora sp. NPDC092948]|uniref:IS5 family transposase n=1 Tax=Kitasatospora sp. NPDC092948 TaxID=3364088 RepID=UPI0038064236